MKNIKRILSVVIVLVMCLSSLPTFAASQTTVKSTEELYAEMDILRSLGFIGDYYDYNTNLNEAVSRADFVRSVAKLINASTSDEDVTYYYDVPKSHYAYSEISALTRMGVINGTGDKRFEPEKAIEAGAAYKVLLSLMGYGQRAEADGGYPAGYIKTARSLKIYNGESFSGAMTRGSMFDLIFNAMKTKVYNIASLGDNSIKYETSDKDTLLSLYHDIYYDEAVVCGADMTTIDGSNIDSGYVKIGKTVYKTEVSLFDKLGEEIKFFYHQEDENEKGTVIWAQRTNDSDVVIITDDMAPKFNKNTFALTYYDENSNTKRVSIDRSVTVIYNGGEVGTDVDKMFALPEATIKLVKLDGKFSVAIIEKAETVVAGNIGKTEKIVYDKSVPAAKVDLDENNYDYISISDAVGIKMEFNQIKSGDVLSAYKSLDGKYLRVIVSSSTAAGTVDGIETTVDGTDVIIADVAYTILNTSSASVPNAGDNVILYLDFKGNVAYTEISSGEYFAAYVYMTKAATQGVDRSLKFKMLSQKGEILELECADKVICDGEKKTTSADIAAVFGEIWGDKSADFKPQIALITLNKDGKIREIDTAYVNSPAETTVNTLSENLAQGNYYYKWTGLLGGHGIIGNSTVIFSVPAAADIATAKDKAFTIKTKSDLSDATTYNISGYKVKERTGYEQFVVMTAAASNWSNFDLPFLVNRKSKVTDEDGAPIVALKGYLSDVESTVKGAEGVTFDDVKQGMLIRLKYDSYGQVEDYRILFDPTKEIDANKKLVSSRNESFDDNYGIVLGYVNDVVDGVVKIGCTSADTVERIADRQGSPILIYDLDDTREPISSGNFSDAETYYNCGDACSKIVMQSYAGTPKFFVIYK